MQSTLQGTLTDAKFWAAAPVSLSDPVVSQLRALIEPDMAVESVEIPSHRDLDGVLLLRGRLLRRSDAAFAHWLAALQPHGYVPLLRPDATGSPNAVTVGILIDAQEQRRLRVWLVSLIFILFVFGALWFGATLNTHEEYIVLHWGMLSPAFLLTGLPFAATLIGIAIAWGLGYYFAARCHHVAATLPYFILMPIGVSAAESNVRLKEKIPDRRKLFDISVAGPLAGLALAVPLLFYGLATSSVSLPQTSGDYSVLGDSILTYAAKLLIFGRALPDLVTGEILVMNQVCFAAWFAVLAIAINLLPVGHSDGGHMVFAMLGERAKIISYVLLGAAILPALASCAPVQSMLPALTGIGLGGWLWLWAIGICWGLRRRPMLDYVTPLNRWRWFAGVLVLLIFVLILTPVLGYRLPTPWGY